jgi:hypothetical protein
MRFRRKLLLVFALTILVCVAVAAWTTSFLVRRTFEKADAERTAALVAQFRREFDHRGEEVARRVEAVRPFARYRLYPNPTPMPLDDLFADGEAHAGSFILAAPAVEPLERRENPLGILLFEADAIILNDDLKLTVVNYDAPNFDDRLLVFFVKLQRVPYKVLEKLPHLRGVGFDNREF